MQKWIVILCAGNWKLGEIDMKWDIFQRKSLSPLVYILALIPSNLILGKAKVV